MSERKKHTAAEQLSFHLSEGLGRCELGPEHGGAQNCTGKATIVANGKKVCAQCAFYAGEGETRESSNLNNIFRQLEGHSEDSENR